MPVFFDFTIPSVILIGFGVVFGIYRDFFGKFLTHRLFRIAKLSDLRGYHGLYRGITPFLFANR